ncbi:alpha/beta hydrolase [Duganella sp. HH105]|uniref:alpha/beta hydrolase n=1 Tax=Duganella sp. HH105 TaxID=1781067 RepID=UPI000877BACF|nr:alpha/beta fold hydrolase [Duganella sp. HH105]OEZ60110.1 alpha/beta hydrolase family protein [Duganella sp. HH105]
MRKLQQIAKAAAAAGALSLSIIAPAAGAAPLREQDDTVTVAGVEIACRLTFPSGPARGAVLLLPGSLFSDVDGNYPTMNIKPHLYADLAAQLGERGFAVLRMAKIGPGTGSRTVDAQAGARHAVFATRAEVASAGLALLRKAAPARPLIVAGHSEGALVASLLASGPDATAIDGVVMLSGPALPILSLLREQVAAMAPPGASPDLAMLDRAIAAIRAGEPLPAGAQADPQTAMLATMPAFSLAYLRSTDLHDPVAELARVRQPVLIVQGGRDGSVPPAHAARLHEGRNKLPTELARFPELNHFYKVTPPDMPPMQSMALDTTSDPSVAERIARWAQALR